MSGVLTIDGAGMDIGKLTFHAQDDPYPGGSHYELCITDPDIVAAVRTFAVGERRELTKQEANTVFNLIRTMTGLAMKRRGTLNVQVPAFFANTIRRLEVTETYVRLAGVCSRAR